MGLSTLYYSIGTLSSSNDVLLQIPLRDIEDLEVELLFQKDLLQDFVQKSCSNAI